MVIVKEDSDGRVIAYAEFRLVDETGRDHEKGVYVWIHDVWIHKTYRAHNNFNAILKEFIHSQSINFPWAVAIYWQRGKYGKRMSLYNREKILRRIYGGEPKEAGYDCTAAACACADTAAV